MPQHVWSDQFKATWLSSIRDRLSQAVRKALDPDEVSNQRFLHDLSSRLLAYQSVEKGGQDEFARQFLQKSVLVCPSCQRTYGNEWQTRDWQAIAFLDDLPNRIDTDYLNAFREGMVIRTSQIVAALQKRVGGEEEANRAILAAWAGTLRAAIRPSPLRRNLTAVLGDKGTSRRTVTAYANTGGDEHEAKTAAGYTALVLHLRRDLTPRYWPENEAHERIAAATGATFRQITDTAAALDNLVRENAGKALQPVGWLVPYEGDGWLLVAWDRLLTPVAHAPRDVVTMLSDTDTLVEASGWDEDWD